MPYGQRKEGLTVVEAIRAWVISLAILALVAGLAEAVMPEGSMRKYARVTLGMVIIAHILNPVISFASTLRSGRQILPVLAVDPSYPVNARPQDIESFESLVRWQVNTMVSAANGVKSASTHVTLAHDSGSPKVAAVNVDLELEPDYAARSDSVVQAIQALVAAYLGLEPKKVQVRIAG